MGGVISKPDSAGVKEIEKSMIKRNLNKGLRGSQKNQGNIELSTISNSQANTGNRGVSAALINNKKNAGVSNGPTNTENSGVSAALRNNTENAGVSNGPAKTGNMRVSALKNNTKKGGSRKKSKKSRS